MSQRWISLLVMLVVVAFLSGCVGYFHYHPVKATEQERARQAGEKLFSEEAFDSSVGPGISGAPVAEETLLKEEMLIK